MDLVANVTVEGLNRLAQLSSLLRDRRSIRRYRPEPVPAEVIHWVLEAATAAPSAHNRQPWRFVVIESPSHKEKLARAMGERLRADRTRDSDAVDAIEADVARSHARLTGSPVLIVACLTMADMDVYPDARRANAEYQMAVQSTAMATQNLLLAAHAVGLGACWMCAPLFCPDTVAGALNLAVAWQPQAIVTLGYPAGKGKPYSRKAVDDVTRILRAAP